MSGGLLSRRVRSLRTRLLLTVVALLAVVGCLIGVVTTVALEQQLVRQVDERLEMTAQAGLRPDGGPRGAQDGPGGDAEPAPACSPASRSWRGPGPAFGTLSACFVDGALLTAASGVLDPDSPGFVRSLDHADTALLWEAVTAATGDGRAGEAADGGVGARTVTLSDGSSYRVRVLGDAEGTAAVLGQSLAEAQATLSRIVVVEVVAISTCIALAAVVGSVLLRRDLAPLRRVAATAARVSELPLHAGEVALAERVPDADTDPGSEVGQVGAALNRLLDHVGAALSARHASEQQVRQFVADASHELRTPLAAIRGYAELTRRRGSAADPVPDDVAHALRRVEAEALRMSGLVEDLLLLARLDAGRPLAREEVDLTVLVLDAVSDARAAGPAHHWRLDLPEDVVTACGDPARLHQVLANLLANARTHTPAGTTVTTGLRWEADPARGPGQPGDHGRGGHVLVEVCDDGPGIDPAVLPHVFERFARADTSRSRAAGSTGLGLAIVDAVVSAHGGTVGVASAPGRTLFQVRLPTSVPTSVPASVPGAAARG